MTREVTANDGQTVTQIGGFGTAFKPSTGIVAAVAGNVNVEWVSGRTSDVYLVVGPNPYHVVNINSAVSAAAGDLTVVWADETP